MLVYQRVAGTSDISGTLNHPLFASRTEADSAESMKFGVCKFCKMPNVNSKERERWKQIQDGDLDVKISSV